MINKAISENELIVKGKNNAVRVINEDDNAVYLEINSNASLFLFEYKKNLNINITSSSEVNICSVGICNTYVEVFKDSSLNITVISTNGGDSEYEFKLTEEGACVNYEMLCVTDDVVKINQNVIHKAKNTTSQINNIGVALKNGEIYFDTVGKIEAKMSSSNCRQLSRGLILGEEAIVSSKPVLLIDEYDVLAYHGASIGKINEEDLFYLMSRGLNKVEAYSLVVDGIVAPFIDKVLDEAKRNELKDKIYKMIY